MDVLIAALKDWQLAIAGVIIAVVAGLQQTMNSRHMIREDRAEGTVVTGYEKLYRDLQREVDRLNGIVTDLRGVYTENEELKRRIRVLERQNAEQEEKIQQQQQRLEDQGDQIRALQTILRKPNGVV